MKINQKDEDDDNNVETQADVDKKPAGNRCHS